mmetsp:Transcript_25586/g.59571  ORF Transcript_25586/g.59571 Transcript_25586/m.59571 type:complete len:611 (-) Transcript_25586:127-1959(-)
MSWPISLTLHVVICELLFRIAGATDIQLLQAEEESFQHALSGLVGAVREGSQRSNFPAYYQPQVPNMLRPKDGREQQQSAYQNLARVEEAATIKYQQLKQEEAHLANFLRSLHDGLAQVEDEVGEAASDIDSPPQLPYSPQAFDPQQQAGPPLESYVREAPPPSMPRQAYSAGEQLDAPGAPRAEPGWQYSGQALQHNEEALLRSIAEHGSAGSPSADAIVMSQGQAAVAQPPGDLEFVDAATPQTEAAGHSAVAVDADGDIFEDDKPQHLNGNPCAIPDAPDHGLSADEVESKNKMHESFPDYCVPTSQIASGTRCMPTCDEAAGYIPSTTAALTCRNGKLHPATYTCERGCKTIIEVGRNFAHVCKSDSKILSAGDTCLAPSDECTDGEAKTLACMPDGTFVESTDGCAPAACKMPQQTGLKACQIAAGGASLAHGGTCNLECREMWTPKAKQLTCVHGVVQVVQEPKAALLQDAHTGTQDPSGVTDEEIEDDEELVEASWLEEEVAAEEDTWVPAIEDAHRRRFCMRPCETPQGEGGPYCTSNPPRIRHHGHCEFRCQEGFVPSHTKLICIDGMLVPSALDGANSTARRGFTGAIPHCLPAPGTAQD